MFIFEFKEDLSKEDFYREVNSSLKHLIDGQRNWITNFANASSLLNQGMGSANCFKGHPMGQTIIWVGFYIKDNKDPQWLYLGPFQGKVACTKIKLGRGVCGTAAQKRETQVVTNVHEFPGHIACDDASNSEIVVPIIHPTTNDLIGVLDIDSKDFNTFDETDKVGLEEFVRILVDGSDVQ